MLFLNELKFTIASGHFFLVFFVLLYFRTIHVYDTDRESFSEFLKFIYTGDLDTESKTLENLLELVALSDQYEVI